jgi:uncharacterized membrane protein
VTQVRNLLALLRGQFWIVPALITAFAAALAVVVLRYGSGLLGAGSAKFWWLYSGDAETARELLSSLLSGLITMTSLVVSVTFVILTLAANQLGPRLIAIFMADRQIQFVLGLFLATILYIILVLRTLNDTLGPEGVPHLAVSIASGLTIACLFSLLFYIHKIGRSIIADNVVREVSEGLRGDLSDLLADHRTDEATEPELEDRHRHPLALHRRGYIQVIDYDKLVTIGRDAEAVLEIRMHPGDFILTHGDHVVVHGKCPVGQDIEDKIRAAFTVASERTPAQDPRYGLGQLVEIALRALSPGINDPRTAMAVIDHLGGAFEEIFTRSVQPRILTDEKGAVRVIAERSDLADLFDLAFDPIRQAGAQHPLVLVRMADSIAKLSPVADKPTARDILLAQLAKLAETARLAALTAADRAEVFRHIESAEETVAEPPTTPSRQSIPYRRRLMARTAAPS